MIGVYGGTFDPVHFAHLRTALEVAEIFALEQLRLIPCRIPAHRDEPEVDAEMRLEMLQIATADVPEFIVDRRELERSGPSFMVDTLSSLRVEHPHTGLILFIGTDAFAGLQKWHQWQRLFEYAHVVVMTRPGFAMQDSSLFLRQRLSEDANELMQQLGGRLFFQTVTALDISASRIRALLRQGRDPKFLLPDAVLRYIRQHNLYLSL